MTRFSVMALLFVLFASCSETTGPSDVAGYYVLTAVDSSQVPHLVSATVSCDEFVLRGDLHLASNGTFELPITQSQDCSRAGGTVDTFTTTTSGAFSVNRGHLALHPAGTGILLSAQVAGGAVDLQLPELPLLDVSPHSGRFLIFPQ